MKELYTALLKVQEELTGVLPNAENPYHESSYANLKAVIEAVKPEFNKAGILVQQTNKAIENAIIVITQLIHVETGQALTSELQLPLKNNTPQDAGSALTFARRYALATVAGLYQEDDDGNAASLPKPAPTKVKQTPAPAPAPTPAPQPTAKEQLKAIYLQGNYKIAEFQKLIGLNSIDKSTEAQCQQGLQRYQSIIEGAKNVK